MSQPENKPSSAATSSAPAASPDKKSVVEKCPCQGAAGLTITLSLVRVAPAAASSSTRSGPAKVSSAAYAKGWDGINWGSKGGAA